MSNITTRPLTTNELVALVTNSKPPWKHIFFLSAYLGLRISDLLTLPWTETPPEGPVFERKTKKYRSILWSELSTHHWKALWACGQPRDYLFQFRDPSTYRKRLQAEAKRLGFSTPRISYHSLRKTHAVIAYRRGGMLAAKASMNHSSLNTTERYVSEALRLESSVFFDTIFTPSTKSVGEIREMNHDQH